MNYQYDQSAGYGKQLDQPKFCNVCGKLQSGASSVWNSHFPPCECTPAERKQLTADDVRRIVREELELALRKTKA